MSGNERQPAKIIDAFTSNRHASFKAFGLLQALGVLPPDSSDAQNAMDKYIKEQTEKKRRAAGGGGSVTS